MAPKSIMIQVAKDDTRRFNSDCSVHGLENAIVHSPLAFLSRYSYRNLKRTDLRNLHMFDNPEKYVLTTLYRLLRENYFN